MKSLALAPDARLLQMTRLRYPKDAFATGPLVLTTSHFRADFLEFFQNYDMEKSPRCTRCSRKTAMYQLCLTSTFPPRR